MRLKNIIFVVFYASMNILGAQTLYTEEDFTRAKNKADREGGVVISVSLKTGEYNLSDPRYSLISTEGRAERKRVVAKIQAAFYRRMEEYFDKKGNYAAPVSNRLTRLDNFPIVIMHISSEDLDAIRRMEEVESIVLDQQVSPAGEKVKMSSSPNSSLHTAPQAGQ